MKHCPVVSQESPPERRLVGHRGRSRATTGLNCVARTIGGGLLVGRADFAMRSKGLGAASVVSGTEGSNPLRSSAESATNLVAAGGVARGWDPEFESTLLQRRVTCEPDFLDQAAGDCDTRRCVRLVPHRSASTPMPRYSEFRFWSPLLVVTRHASRW